jgi:hypothetical protein
MINIVGIGIVALGFFAPYVSNGRLPSTVLFWIGGLLFLKKGIIIKSEANWTKRARFGIWANIALFLIMLATFYLTAGRIMNSLGHWFSMLPYWLARPATALSQQLFPSPATHHPDGSVTIHMDFTRTVITDFLDIVLFAVTAVVIGMFWARRQKNAMS